MGFKEMVFGVVIAALAILAMIQFAFMTMVNNNADQNILNDPSIAGINNSLSSTLNNIRGTAQSQRQAFENQQAQGGTDQGFSLTSIVGAIKTFIGTAVGSFNLTLGLIANIFGIPPIVLNTLLGGIIVVILLLGWRVIKIGGT